MTLSDNQIAIIRRMKKGEPLTRSKDSGLFWIDTYDQVKSNVANSLIYLNIIQEDTDKRDNYSVFYKLDPTLPG